MAETECCPDCRFPVETRCHCSTREWPQAASLRAALTTEREARELAEAMRRSAEAALLQEQRANGNLIVGWELRERAHKAALKTARAQALEEIACILSSMAASSRRYSERRIDEHAEIRAEAYEHAEDAVRALASQEGGET